MISLTGIVSHNLDLSLNISQPVQFVSEGDRNSSSSTTGAIPFTILESTMGNTRSSSVTGQSYHMSMAQEHHPHHVQIVQEATVAPPPPPPAAFFLPNIEVRKSQFNLHFFGFGWLKSYLFLVLHNRIEHLGISRFHLCPTGHGNGIILPSFLYSLLQYHQDSLVLILLNNLLLTLSFVVNPVSCVE